MRINNYPILQIESQASILLNDWINYQDSLTEKLNALNGGVQLEVLSQKWIKPTWWDNFLLQIKSDLVLQREIMMKSNGVCCWYARTIIPQICYHLNPGFFGRLEKESIKNLIFNNDDVHRVTMAAYPIDKQCTEFYWVKKYLHTVDNVLWVRYAEYSYKHLAQFYIIEILLPDLEKLLR